MSRPRLAARLAAIALCGASFIATSPPDWTDMMGVDFEVLTLDATHTAVAMTGHGSTADGFDPPVLSFALSGDDTGAGCIVTAYRLEAAWPEAYDEAGLPVVPEGAEALIEATLSGPETAVMVDIDDVDQDEDAHILFASDGACAFSGRAVFRASAYASKRSDDPKVDGDAEVTAPADQLSALTKTEVDY
jgi:hypothetical protein